MLCHCDNWNSISAAMQLIQHNYIFLLDLLYIFIDTAIKWCRTVRVIRRIKLVIVVHPRPIVKFQDKFCRWLKFITHTGPRLPLQALEKARHRTTLLNFTVPWCEMNTSLIYDGRKFHYSDNSDISQLGRKFFMFLHLRTSLL